MKISACLIVYNEEKIIRECFESIKNVVDEILVVHDGPCSDKTLDIAREYADKIYVRDHAGYMEAHVPFALEKADNDWILRIDADESLPSETSEEMKSLMETGSADAYEFIWPLWNGKRRITEKWPHKILLFDKKKISFLGLMHFRLCVNGIKKRVDYAINHKPDVMDFSVMIRKKWLERARLQAHSYYKNFSDINAYNHNKNDWPRGIILRKRSPVLMVLPDAFLTLFRGIFSKNIFINPIVVIKETLLHMFYKMLVDYNLARIKYKI